MWLTLTDDIFRFDWELKEVESSGLGRINTPELLFHVILLLLSRYSFYIEHAINFNDNHMGHVILSNLLWSVSLFVCPFVVVCPPLFGLFTRSGHSQGLFIHSTGTSGEKGSL